MRKNYRVQQIFETLGDPCRSMHCSRRAAEGAAIKLARGLVKTLVDNADPDADEEQQFDERHAGGGVTREIEFWDRWTDREILRPGNRGALIAALRHEVIEIEQII